ncbi:MAG: CHAT domain-containing protein, partial [Candidatus Nitrotoga sp.]
YLRTLSISEKANGAEHPDTGVRLNNLADLYRTMARYAEAEPLYLRTLSISEKANGAEHPDTGVRLNNLADLYRTMARYAEAEPLYLRALSISEKANGTEHPDTALSLNNLALLYRTTGRYAEAGQHLLRALQIARLNNKPELTWTVLGNLSFIYATTHPDLAIWFGKQAVNTLQAVRATNTGLDKETQKSFLQKNVGYYKYLADLLFAQGRLIEGQQVLAMLKETEYFDFIQRNAETDPRKSRSELTGQEQLISQRYEEIQANQVSLAQEYRALLTRQKSWKEADKIRYQQLDEDLAVARTRFTQFVAQLKQELSKQSSHSDERLLEIGGKNLDALNSFKDTLKKLGYGAVTLHYLSTDQYLWILLTTSNTQLARKVVISNTELNTLIAQYRNAIAERSPEVNKLGKQLYDLVIAPIADDLRQAHAQTLMLSLDGALRYLPMAALFDGQQYLAESYRLAIYTEVAKDKIKDPSNPNWHFAGFGLTRSIGGFGALPGVKNEFEGMSKQGLPGAYLLDDAFTADAFKLSLIQSPPVVHVASHFKFQPGNETNSFLLLGDGNKLSLGALKNGNYQFTDVDLLTLSACETAVGGGKGEDGREIEGFGVLAQNQGAKSVLATLWQVNDSSTGQFMQMFYHIRQSNPGMTKAEALQQTQQAFIKGQVVLEAQLNPQRVDAAAKSKVTTDHPYYWAPFILMGNWL